MLATGLSALYSDLPTSLDIPSEDWYSLERGLWATFPELVSFLRSLEFCNNVVQVLVLVNFPYKIYYAVILLPLRPAFLTHKNLQRCKIIHGTRPAGCKEQSAIKPTSSQESTIFCL